LKDVKTRIKDLKEAGILPEEFLEIIKNLEKDYKKINSELEKFINERVSDKVKVKYEDFLKSLTQTLSKGEGLARNSLYSEIISSLEKALEEDELSEWKTKFTEEVEKQKFLKGTKNLEKMYSLQAIYENYEKQKREEKVIDYADIILNTLIELKRNETLRVEIQEFFQFILVDEFQDTNNAQFEILKILTSHEAHEGKPNIMVVGDDDQAVYRFQGGDVQNIFDFQKLYKEVKVVILEDNYRSMQNILDLGKSVIKEVRKFEKNLMAKKGADLAKPNPPQENIQFFNFENEEIEMNFIAKNIKQKIENGIPAHEIAIIAKKHKQLEALTYFLNQENLKYSYEKETSLLENPKIQEILIILKCINSRDFTKSNIENYLPQILSFPFWQIPKIEIIKLAIQIRKEKSNWFEQILKSEIPEIKKVAEFLENILSLSATTPLYHLIDKIMQDSPFKAFYFTDLNQEYLNFLEDLKTLYEVIKNYKKEKMLYAYDIEVVLQNIKQYALNIKQTQEINKEGHVILLTSHKSKGLEYEHVYMLGMNKKNWASRGKNSLLTFPIGLNYTRYKEEEADFVRSIYVAITRAKNNLTITHTDNLIAYLEQSEKPELKEENENLKLKEEKNIQEENKKIINFSDFYTTQNLNQEEKDLLKKYVENYKLPPTHLNNFLDLVNAGPNKFIEENILHFPTPPNEFSLFGTLMHNMLELAGKHKIGTGKDIGLKNLQNIYKETLEKEILTKQEYKKLLEMGLETLEKYYSTIEDFGKMGNEKFEVNFSYENVVLDGIKLAGTIDRIQVNKKENEIIIYDYKTGKKTTDNWKGKDENEKIKLYKYKNQLLFYKILLENSNEYKNYKSKTAVLDFIEINKKHDLLFINYAEEKEEIERIKKLIKVVYKKIQNLDFPDVSKYPSSFKGILEFEDDLINERI
jgi:DNA helicase-2/ATP-dependent DNA helicase PcrA